mmetsp:Transcript_67724/g.185718  ORF Transcript_67724/g.185718 Transcript_67724/m.185718 type:complete len:88 (+) Transcript_67724:138-401(+)
MSVLILAVNLRMNVHAADDGSASRRRGAEACQHRSRDMPAQDENRGPCHAKQTDPMRIVARCPRCYASSGFQNLESGSSIIQWRRST